jgi:electron transfer flavoprotein alpha subunit
MSDVLSCILPPLRFDRSVQGLLGAGQRLARELGGKHFAALVGPADSSLTSQIATCCDGVLVASNSSLAEYQPENCLAALEAIARETKAGTILLPNDTYSQEVTPRLAHRLGGCSIPDAQTLAVQDGSVRVGRSVYGGKAMAHVAAKKSPAVIWIRARAMEVAAPAVTAADVQSIEVKLPDAPKTKIVERHAETQTGVRLEDAAIIVSGGRGLGGPEPFELLKGLAGAINAQVAASRAACDAGWVPHSWQVGQTGKKVAPTLYLAIAVSGASQHMMGIADAKNIAAINTDPDAPIFKHCRYGLVEDYRNVVGPLQAKLSALLK